MPLSVFPLSIFDNVDEIEALGLTVSFNVIIIIIVITCAFQYLLFYKINDYNVWIQLRSKLELLEFSIQHTTGRAESIQVIGRLVQNAEVTNEVRRFNQFTIMSSQSKFNVSSTKRALVGSPSGEGKGQRVWSRSLGRETKRIENRTKQGEGKTADSMAPSIRDNPGIKRIHPNECFWPQCKIIAVIAGIGMAD